MLTAYPDQTRLVAQACAELGLAFSDLDDGGGYLFSVGRGEHELIAGAGAVTPYPLNRAGPVQIARDKAHANRILARAGLPVIDSRLCFTTDLRINLRRPGREVADAIDWITAAPGPVFCKPNAGAGGDFAEIIEGRDAFIDYVARVSRHHEAILIQPVIGGEEHRVFCLDGRAAFTTLKAEAVLQGDGVRDLAALLAAHNRSLVGGGVSSLPASMLASPTRVPAAGETVTIGGRRNLAAGGSAQISTSAPEPLARLALQACAAIGLRVGGVDIFDRSAARDLSDLVIIEANGNPAMTSLILAGREELAVALWREILTTHFTELSESRP